MLKMVLLDTEKLPSKQGSELQERLYQLGELTSYVNTNPDELVERCRDAEIILVNKNLLTAEHFKVLKQLKYVIVMATGYDNVDAAAARDYGIKVSNLPTYSATTVAQHTWALLLELTNQVGKISEIVKKEKKWTAIKHRHLEVADLTLGVFGFGNIAQKMIKIALAFGMKVIVSGTRSHYETELPVQFVDRETLFKNSDVISLHCSLNDTTANIINATNLGMMKPTCLLVNTSRGGLIQEVALYEALVHQKIQGAALDVLNQEPVTPDNPLLTLENCIISPHNAWMSEASLQRWQNQIVACVKGYLADELINVII
ncbi:MAG: hypothetical protein K2W99_05960 [Chthoniobacterales bacterium]|nr:hypothetical protein [Chthoniobacterales bacterium]